MANYSRITYHERCRIRQMLQDKKSISEIARVLRRSKSTISTEVRRKGMTKETYYQIHAQQDANFRRRIVHKKRKIQGPLEANIQMLLLERHWSPEQISMYLKTHYPTDTELHVSPEAIYQYVYRSNYHKIFTRALRSKRKRRCSRIPGKIQRGGIRNKVGIRLRDPEAESREIPGHWEGDLIIGKGHDSAIGTLVERSSRYVRIVHLEAKDSISVIQAFEREFQDIPATLKLSLTYDQGVEMSQHQQFTLNTGLPVFFADAGAPWQRGSNENMNGLIREFFPKGTDFKQVSKEELKHVEELLNSRPRKVLNYTTPSQRFRGFAIA